MQDLIIVIGWIAFVIFIAKEIRGSVDKVSPRKKKYRNNYSSVRSYHSTKCFFKSREKNNLNKEYPTLKGDTVKSRGEQLIADYLYSIRVKYKYEKEFIRKDGGKNKPDFYLEDYGIYLEYFGMIGNKKYNYEMHLKFDTFEDEKLKVIEVYPKSIKNGKFKQAIDVQFKNFTGYYLPKNYNPTIHFSHEKNNRNFMHYYFSQGGKLSHTK